MSDELAMLDHRVLLACDYVLFDPLRGDASSWADLPTTSLTPAGCEDQPHLFPRLLELSKLSRSAVVDLLDRQHAWEGSEPSPWFAALLTSGASATQLRHHLLRIMTMRLLDGSKGLLRYYDGRVADHLAWLLEPSQIDQWLGPVMRWGWRTTGGMWEFVERTSPAQSHLRFTPSQVATVERIGAINTVLGRLQDVQPPMAMDANTPRRIDELLAKAWSRQHLSQAMDRELFAEQGMRYGLAIYGHPQLHERLQQARNGQTTYTRACAGMDDATLQRFARELVTHKERP